MKSFIIVLLLFVTVSVWFVQTNAECCYAVYSGTCHEPDGKTRKRCGDCSEVESFYCGVGSCNVFGCNCDGGCRKGDPDMWCKNPYFQCGPEGTDGHIDSLSR